MHRVIKSFRYSADGVTNTELPVGHTQDFGKHTDGLVREGWIGPVAATGGPVESATSVLVGETSGESILPASEAAAIQQAFIEVHPGSLVAAVDQAVTVTVVNHDPLTELTINHPSTGTVTIMAEPLGLATSEVTDSPLGLASGEVSEQPLGTVETAIDAAGGPEQLFAAVVTAAVSGDLTITKQQDPLDHDGDGKKGGSVKGSRRKKAAE